MQYSDLIEVADDFQQWKDLLSANEIKNNDELADLLDAFEQLLTNQLGDDYV